jgi:hypothetical protein
MFMFMFMHGLSRPLVWYLSCGSITCLSCKWYKAMFHIVLCTLVHGHVRTVFFGLFLSFLYTFHVSKCSWWFLRVVHVHVQKVDVFHVHGGFSCL